MAAVDFILAAIPVILSIFIPGFFIALALLKKTGISLFEIACFGFILGLIVPPSFIFLAALIGIPYSLELAIGCVSLATLIGILWCWKEKALEFKLEELTKIAPREALIWGALAFFIILAFYIRVQSMSPTFYEFDPYYYDQVTQFILTQGSVPRFDDLAWFPYLDSHINPPLTNYLTATWYSIYTSGQGAYNNHLLAMVAGIYPPVVGALICFLIFSLLSREYGRGIGLVGAGFAAIVPRVIDKFLAGESEQQPWGVFAAFFFYAAYAYVITKRDTRFAVLAALALAAATLGSKGDMLAYMVLAGYIGVQAVVSYVREKLDWEFVKLNLIVIMGGFVAHFIMMWYYTRIDIPDQPIAVLAAIAFAALLVSYDKLGTAMNEMLGLGSKKQSAQKSGSQFVSRLSYLSVIIVVALIGIAALEALHIVSFTSYINSAVELAKPSSALMQTVAEESPQSDEFTDAVGSILGMKFTGVDLKGIPLFPDSTLNMVHVILALAGVSLLFTLAFGSELSIFLGVIIFPISYVGIRKSKYVLHLSYMIIVALGTLLGGIKKAFEKMNLEDEVIKLAPVAFGAILLCAYAQEPLSVLSASFKYNSVDTNNMTAVNAFCSEMSGANQRVIRIYCQRIPDYWMNAMNFIRDETEKDARVISWWDYGHWINYFGERDCLTRNDHAHPEMDLEVADKFVDNTPEALAEYMRAHNTTYALFDVDLINKWGALNYLSCVYNNETNMSMGPGGSNCEAVHRPETIFVPKMPTQNDMCIIGDQQFAKAYSTFGQVYCMASVKTESGDIQVMLNQDGTYNKAFFSYQGDTELYGRQVAMYLVWYPTTWYDGSSGYGDSAGKGEYYKSTFYQAFFLGELEGFEQVYPKENAQGPRYAVRIFKLKE
ncbi:MAG: STT3 domain-containing protein [Candidatus Micrarchaeota archaeon]